MSQSGPVIYKIADTAEEMEQIHRLNYETFVEEIPQHTVNEKKRLVDRFHAENTYIIAKREDEVIGMAAVRGSRPFSLDEKLGSVDAFLPSNAKPCEIRLLSLKRDYRGTRTFFALCDWLVSYCITEGFDTVLISGTDRQTRLYQHMGFQPFGPVVGMESARFQPMILTKDGFKSSGRLFRQLVDKRERAVTGHFLPGPVPMHRTVSKAWARPAISHRAAAFSEEMGLARKQLMDMTGAKHVEIAIGTGTLANELVAAQLSRIRKPGLIVANGEFGERLIGQAERWQLSFSVIKKPWSVAVPLETIESLLRAQPEIRWLWFVHCETSTGYVYPLDELKWLSRKYGVRLCVDACSSLGVVPTDFSGVHLVSAGSGKGLGAYPGLALVFHEDPVSPDERLPAYLDLGVYARTESTPFTHSSNSVQALNAALAVHRFPDAALTVRVREILKAAGMSVLGDDNSYSPGILTIALPEPVNSRELGDQLKEAGIIVSYESGYLLKRNWIQLAFMGTQECGQVEQAIWEISRRFQAAERDAVG